MRGMAVDIGDEQPAPIGELIGVAAAAAPAHALLRSVVAMAVTLVAALFGLVAGMTLAATGSRLPTFATVLGAMVGLGVGIDYALFVLARHREHLAHGVEVHEAAGRAVATAGQPVVFAGGTVVVVASSAWPSRDAVHADGWLRHRDRRPDHGDRLGGCCLPSSAWPATGSTAGGARPTPAACRTELAAMDRARQSASGPVRDRRLRPAAGRRRARARPACRHSGRRLDAGSRTERRAYDLVAQAFGPGTNGPLVVAVDTAGTPPCRGGWPPRRRRIPDRLRRPLEGAVINRGRITGLIAFPTSGPQEQATLTPCCACGARVAPSSSAPDRPRPMSAGRRRTFDGLGRRVNDRLPLFMAACSPSFVLLMLMAASGRSRAARVRRLQPAAHRRRLRRRDARLPDRAGARRCSGWSRPCPSSRSSRCSCSRSCSGSRWTTTCSCSSRVREEYLRTGDARAAVTHAVGRTASVISSAGAIMTAGVPRLRRPRRIRS